MPWMMGETAVTLIELIFYWGKLQPPLNDHVDLCYKREIVDIVTQTNRRF